MPREKSTTMYVEARERLVQWIRRQLVGPSQAAQGRNDEDTTLLDVSPTERFPCGAIYPTTTSGEGRDPADEDLNEGQTGPDAPVDDSSDPAVVRRYIPPSSLGLSFFITGDEIRIQLICSAARYSKVAAQREDQQLASGGSRTQWERHGLGGDHEVENVSCPRVAEHRSYLKFEGLATLEIRWRPFADGWIFTATLCNRQLIQDQDTTAREFLSKRAKSTLFEAKLRCVIDAGEVGVYPRVDRSLLDDEEQEIEVQYAHRHIFAVGHGAAADWVVRDGRVAELHTETMPAVEVARMTADTASVSDTVLTLGHLADLADDRSQLVSELTAFVGAYREWSGKQCATLSSLNSDDQAAGQRIVKRIDKSIARMQSGIALLGRDAKVRLAFGLANRAMLDQMRQHAKVQGKTRADDTYRWRPFQLAFLLAVLESAANGDSEFRDTVDLIWFPTGGGKTEAYLGLIAFQILLRRLRHADTGGGTCVLMRYTLRLLTRDQFIRASRLILALELMRRERSDLGKEPISIGLWVGEATSPNSYQKAAKIVAEARSDGSVPALVIDGCPWCGHRFHADHSYEVTEHRFRFLCSDPGCDFHGELPCNVVDESLYDNPPTMLVATVDKFARLAWEERATAFFGGSQHRPPELIIQDELHLIAGALGSVAGLYEVGVDTVIRLRGVYPKYIASTATIRMAKEQVRRLYGRDVSVFPPPGLNADDSYFARTVPLEKRPGRLYVGYLAPLLNRQQCMSPLAAALLRAPHVLFEGDQEKEALLDAWWTQVVYHGSLKGVGNSHTAYVSDVVDFVRRLIPPEAGEPSSSEPNERIPAAIAQLTSLQSAEENSAIFARLTVPRATHGCVDAVLATNMVSVGLDVARLALMTINGQPLTTAEYIQASSRVGRSDVPGVVFANYYRSQARSLSHYESFRPYHEAFYRFVEPSSVTPFTHQARQRGLHAALVIAMRHGAVGLGPNDAAADFDPDAPAVKKALDALLRRCNAAITDDKRQSSETEAHLERLVQEWSAEVQRCRSSKRKLSYQVSDQDKAGDRLLYGHTDAIRGLWPALHSMRNVESSALLKVL
jgi:hypothetical protein